MFVNLKLFDKFRFGELGQAVKKLNHDLYFLIHAQDTRHDAKIKRGVFFVAVFFSNDNGIHKAKTFLQIELIVAI